MDPTRSIGVDLSADMTIKEPVPKIRSGIVLLTEISQILKSLTSLKEYLKNPLSIYKWIFKS